MTAVGILGIIFGVGGLFSSTQTILIPKMIEAQKQMLTGMEKSFPGSEMNPGFGGLKEMLEKDLAKTKPWSGLVFAILGLTGVVINGIYVFASISLVLMKRYAVRLFYYIMAISIGFAILRSALAYTAQPFMGTAIAASGIAGLALDIVLMILALSGSKKAFDQNKDTVG